MDDVLGPELTPDTSSYVGRNFSGRRLDSERDRGEEMRDGRWMDGSGIKE